LSKKNWHQVHPVNLEELRQQLLQLQAELAAQQDASGEDTQPVELDQARVGRLSRMDAMQAQAMAQEGVRRRQRLLESIGGALRRMDAGEYGYCFSCGEAIDPRRLQADPTNTRCIRCAEGASG
jgi:DnaK suppressor protein